MLQEDQQNIAAASQQYGGNDDDYYDEENLPDERIQTEVIRRMHHNEVASEAETTLKQLEEINRMKAQLASSPSP